MNDHNKTPITIVAGFLGAGKTTLLNNMLSLRKDRKLAVIVNDFGSINIDSRLIKSVDEGIIELSDGCVCCSIRAKFFDTVMQLLKSSYAPDHIIVECSGISDPGLVSTTLLSPMLRPLLKVDGVITVVDAKNVLSFYKAYPTLVEKQIEFSNFVVLNKIDLISKEIKTEAINFVRKVQPEVRIIEAVNANVPVDLLLGFSEGNGELDNSLNEELNEYDTTQWFDSISYRTDKVFSKRALNDWKDHLPPEIVRAKGILNLGKKEGIVNFSLVGSWSKFEKMTAVTEISESEMVLIGSKGWAEDYDINKKLDQCLEGNYKESGKC